MCTPELLARMFSLNALTKKGTKLSAPDGLAIAKDTVKASNKGSGTISYLLKNTTGQKIDTYNISMRLCNTYGEG